MLRPTSVRCSGWYSTQYVVVADRDPEGLDVAPRVLDVGDPERAVGVRGGDAAGPSEPLVSTGTENDARECPIASQLSPYSTDWQLPPRGDRRPPLRQTTP